MKQTITFTVVPSAKGGLDVVKTTGLTDECGNITVISSSSAQLRLTGGEKLPGNIAAKPIDFVVLGSILIVSSQTPEPSGFIRFWAWEILNPSSLEPISSENILFLTEFGQIVKKNLSSMCFDSKQIGMTHENGRVLLHAPRTRILVGGIAKTKTKSFSLQFKNEMNKRGKKTLGDIRINPVKQKKDK